MDTEGDPVPTPELWRGLRMVPFFPVEGESAIAELWFDGAVWAQVRLRGVRLDEVGEARVDGATFDVDLFPPTSEVALEWWTFDYDDVVGQLAEARGWLLDNETARLPIEDEGLTAAGAALSKAAADHPLIRSVADEEAKRALGDG